MDDKIICVVKEDEGIQCVEGTGYLYDKDLLNKARQYRDEAKNQADRAQDLAEDFEGEVFEKTQEFNQNAADKLSDYNENDILKLTAYNTNAAEKLSSYNENAADKQAAVDEMAGQAQTAAQEALVSSQNAQTYEENARIWAEGTQGEVSSLGGEKSSKGWAQKSKETFNQIEPAVEEGLNQLANASDTLRMVNITNTLTQVTQDIKLELTSGALVLKEGSKLYVPAGFEENGTTKKFETVTVPLDLTLAQAGTNTTAFGFCLTADNNFASVPFQYQYSGSSVPEGTVEGSYWYDTTNNIIKILSNGQWLTNKAIALPVCIFDNVNGSVTSYRSFNGFGFMGALAYVLPGVECLLSDGRNPDGSLNNIKYEVTSVLVSQREYVWEKYPDQFMVLGQSDGIGHEGFWFLNHYKVSEEKPLLDYCLWYKPSENRMYLNNSENTNGSYEICHLMFIGFVGHNGTQRVTSFSVSAPFEAADVSKAAQKDKNEVIEATWTFGASDLGNLEGGQIQLKMDPEHDSYIPMIIDANNGMGRIYGGPADNLKVFNFNFSDGLLTIPGEVLATDISIHAATTAYVRNVTRPNYGAWYAIAAGMFVAPTDGWIGIYGNVHNNLTFGINCDGLEMVRALSTVTTGIELRFLIPVVAGKTYAIVNNAENGNQYFVPNMGGF